MPKFFFENPNVSGLFVASIVIISLPVAGSIIESIYYKPESGCVDNCGGFLVSAALMASLFLGVLTGLFTVLILKLKQKP